VREAAALAAAVVLTAAPAGAADVTLVGPRGRVALSEAEQAEIASIVRREAETCSLNSLRPFFAPERLDNDCRALERVRRPR
jgi:hypothetical protein